MHARLSANMLTAGLFAVMSITKSLAQDRTTDRCSEWQEYYEGDNLMGLDFKCSDENGDDKCTRINPDMCLVNADGYLAPAEFGYFEGTCFDYDTKGDHFRAKCYAPDGSQIYSSIAIDDFLTVNDIGDVRCDSVVGSVIDC